MLGSWTLSIDGREHVVTIERSQNGKDVARVNGRVIAKPIGADENERGIIVGGVPYSIQRTGPDSFDLVQDDVMLAGDRSRDAAAAVLAHEGDIPLAARKSEAAIKFPLLGWAAIVAIIAVMMVYATGDSYADQAGKRVDQILDQMKSGESVQMQFAVTLWAKNKRVLDYQEMSWASDNFDRWLREKNLYNKAFTTWEILDSQDVEGAANPTAIVTFKIEDREYEVRVPKDAPISWEK
jgi:hypothetical protein